MSQQQTLLAAYSAPNAQTLSGGAFGTLAAPVAAAVGNPGFSGYRRLVVVGAAGAVAVSIPAVAAAQGATAAPVGSILDITVFTTAASTVTITPAAGTIDAAASFALVTPAANNQVASFRLRASAVNAWVLA